MAVSSGDGGNQLVLPVKNIDNGVNKTTTTTTDETSIGVNTFIP